MSTKTHKPATTSDILPADPATNPSSEALLAKEDPSIQKSTNPFPLRARCGNVARLPKEIRDQLNEMLLDGVPHHQIIQKLHDQFGPQSNLVPLEPTGASAENGSNDSDSNSDHATRNTQHESDSQFVPQNPAQIEDQNGRTSLVSKIANLTSRHITNWKKFGGYRDWLRDQQRIEECKLRHELTLDLARSAEGLASYQAAPKVAVAQICQTIIDIGPDGLKESLQGSPLNCFRLLNALARLINSGLKCEQQIQKTAIAANKEKWHPADSTRWARIEHNLNLL